MYDAEFERRGAQLEELIGLLRALWRASRRDHAGRFYTVQGRIEPVPATPPQVRIGGWGLMTIRRWRSSRTPGCPVRPPAREAARAARGL
ncbi:MAG: LLM class flavin-dependent oxidoreductase [Chloroflexota bacterium]